MASGVNNLTIKLIIIVIINLATNVDDLSGSAYDEISFLATGTKNANDYFAHYDNQFEDLMISPNTPVLYVEPLDEDHVKITEEFDVFRATQAYRHYNNPANDRSNTFVLNILLMLDNFEGKNPYINETRHTNRILQIFDNAAKALNKLSIPKIKLHISGVVKMKQINTSGLKLREETPIWFSECYDIYSTSNSMSDWLFENYAPSGEIDYDMFVFAANQNLCIENGGKLERRSYYLPKNIDCTNPDDSGHPPGGLLYFNDENAALYIIQMIAKKFGVRNDSDAGCASDPDVPGQYYMDLKDDERLGVFRSWSECSKADFANIVDNKNFEHYKMPAGNEVEENHESGYKNLILGPNTYVYKIDFPHDNYVKVESDSNKFQATPTYNYYRSSDVDLSNTYIVNILLIYDWRLNETNPNSNILSDSILKQLNTVAGNLNNLHDVKIKLRISGIAIPQRSDIFNLPETQKMPLWEEPCYHSNASLHYLRDWLLENKERFENPSFDFFLFVTSRFTCDEENKLYIGPILEYDCNSTSTLVESSGGLIQYDPFFSLHVTQMIADRFHINEDDVNCGSGHIMDLNKTETCLTAINPRSWSDCSRSAFQSITSKEEYSCYKMPAFNPDSVDNDYQ